MFTTSRILAVSLLATLASALPTKLPSRAAKLAAMTEEDAFTAIKRAATVYTSCSVPNTVAMTFDDGPYIYETDIVNTLAQYGAKGTFFVNGNNWACIYSDASVASLQNTFAAGHQIGSHTWAHLDWATLSNDQLTSEMTRTDDALVKILGVKPAFVRPPYGSYTAASLDIAGQNAQNVVTWDFDSGDSDGATVQQSETTYQNAINAGPSSILALNHETYATTAQEVLPFALNALQAKGYQFVTVAECLGMDPYVFQQAPQSPDATWTC